MVVSTLVRIVFMFWSTAHYIRIICNEQIFLSVLLEKSMDHISLKKKLTCWTKSAIAHNTPTMPALCVQPFSDCGYRDNEMNGKCDNVAQLKNSHTNILTVCWMACVHYSAAATWVCGVPYQLVTWCTHCVEWWTCCYRNIHHTMCMSIRY